MPPDIFICYASEDREDVVKPIVQDLNENDVSCWWDQGEILWGDSITDKINEGLSRCRYVVLVISDSFLQKNWPQRELNSVLNTEASTGQVKALPLLVGNEATRSKILSRYYLLNDKQYLIWEGNTTEIVDALLRRLDRKNDDSGSIESTAPPHSIQAMNFPTPSVQKNFSQRDKDLYLRDAFVTIRDYFKAALDNLNSTVFSTDLIDVNSQTFTAKIYVNGDIGTQCRIWIDDQFGSENIHYFEGRHISAGTNTYNESISAEVFGQELLLKFFITGIFTGDRKQSFTPIDAAKSLWTRFIAPLNR